MSKQQFSGILNINKPSGVTSHDVVKSVRKILGIKKVGHCGTLDPLATGVLLVCVGQATRLIEYLVASQKVYLATVKLGQTTTTFDAEGEVIATAKADHLTANDVIALFPEFSGRIWQVPPRYSAIKQGGVPLYKLARQGIEVDPQARAVQIDALELICWQGTQFDLRVTCQAGTYIRSLAHDMGQRLEVGAHLTALTRLSSGDWSVEYAVTLEDLAQAATERQLETVLHPKEMALTQLPQITLSEEEAAALRLGQKIATTKQFVEPVAAGCDAVGKLVALLSTDISGELAPKKVFH